MEPPPKKVKQCFEKTITMNQESTLVFIGLVQQREVLWNRKDPFYKDKVKQNDAWLEISTATDIPVSDLIRKWKSLCGTYRHYHSKVSVSKVTGSATNAIFKPTWFAYDSMNFMQHIRECKTTLSTLSCDMMPNKSRPLTDSASTKLNENVAASVEPNKTAPSVPSNIPTIEHPVYLIDDNSEESNESSSSPHQLVFEPIVELQSNTNPLSQSALQQKPSSQRLTMDARTAPALTRNGRTQMASYLSSETETLDILRVLANHTVQHQDPQAAKFGQTVCDIVTHFSTEIRDKMLSEILQVVHRQTSCDADVLQYEKSIMELMQTMDKSK